MARNVEERRAARAGQPEGNGTRTRHYDRSSLTYADTFTNPAKVAAIHALEWSTGKISILRMVREFERMGAPQDASFFRAVLDVMRIPLQTPSQQMERIPSEGPVVVVANHPHGLVDGMVLAELIGKRRPDYKILTRSLLTQLDAVADRFLISVPFPHEPDAQQKSIEMRDAAMAQLEAGGVIGLFPSGVVASADRMFGPAVEREWNVFTAKMIRRSGARVVPVFFPGQNSRWYQIASRVSPTLRQGLLIHEIVKACNTAQSPLIGHPLDPAEVAERSASPRDFMAWLRAHTLSLGNSA
ncbi:lysophospholipid acyltransferase family protein [Poseidonocella pacifica]|uniref:lysophospholipid acyltransferase family protein n=1 Tax=Poseidonocella pacifica TaxID=871651 RepID=UPI000AD7BF95